MQLKPGIPAEFLGKPEEICFVSHAIDRTMRQFVALGIGPWRVYTFDPGTVSEQTYHGQPAEWALRVAFAENEHMIWEIMQPLWGPSIFADFLKEKGEGVHHISFDLNGIPWDQRIETFRQRGYSIVQSGIWAGKCRFAYYDTQPSAGLVFESYLFAPDWVDPVPDNWFPAHSEGDV